MKCVLFILLEGKAGCWEVSRGTLVRRTLKGDRWHPFTATFWDDLKIAYQISDDDEVDTLFLSDQKGAFGRIPGFLKIERKTSWTMELLASVAKDPDFSEASIYIQQSVGQSLLIGALDPVRELSFELLPASDFSLPEGEYDRRFRAVFNVSDGTVFERYQHGVIAAARMATGAEDDLKFETDEWIHLVSTFRVFGFLLTDWVGIVGDSFKNDWNTEAYVGQCCACLQDERLQRLFLADCTRTYIDCGGDAFAWRDSLGRILNQVGADAKGWLEWLRVVMDVARDRRCDPEQEKSLRILFEQYEVKYLLGDYLRDAEIVKQRQIASVDERKAMFRCIVLDALVRGKEDGFVDIGRRIVRCSVPTYGSQRYLFSDDCICGLGIDDKGSVAYMGPSLVERSDWSLEKTLECLRAYYDQLGMTDDFTQATCDIIIDGLQFFLSQIDRQIEDAVPEDSDYPRAGWGSCCLENYKGGIAEFNDMFEAVRNCLNLPEGVSSCFSPCFVVELDRQVNNDAVVKFPVPQWKDLLRNEEWPDLTSEPYALITPDIIVHSNVVTWDKSRVEESHAKKVASAFFQEIPKWLASELRQNILNSTNN